MTALEILLCVIIAMLWLIFRAIKPAPPDREIDEDSPVVNRLGSAGRVVGSLVRRIIKR